MDWQTLRARYPAPKGQPDRCARLLALGRVLHGTQYDALPHDFATERSGAGEYIPLADRRPSVRSNLCRTVVDDSVSLLFGDTHWPTIIADNADAGALLAQFCAEARIEPLMMHAATIGSVGSVALLVEIAESVPRVSVLDTAYLTPVWDNSGTLESVEQLYAVRGTDLTAIGYTIPQDLSTMQFWFRRVWTVDECVSFVPMPVSIAIPAARDEERSSRHGLGFVPIVWVRNIGGQPGDPDGECTFERAIDTVIEADYLLSQAGRGLKYGSDPTLVLKTGGFEGGPAREGGASTALTLPPEGDAKLLEINGNAAGAVLAHYRELRALVLEQVHGSRAHADRLASGQSGRAMEMMSQSLVWLADRLRQSYGAALVELLRMICALSSVAGDGVKIGGENRRGLDPTGIRLHWPPWFAPTEPELLAMAQALVTAVDGGLLSSETASAIYAARVGIENAPEEWERIQAEIADGMPKKAPSTVRKDAGDGKTLSRQVEA